MSGDGEIVWLPVNEISPGPAVRLERYDWDNVANLRGVLDIVPPIVVRQTAKGWSLIDGTHRLAAAGKEGWDKIRAVVVALDDAEALEAAIEANIAHGLGLTASERAANARKLIESTKYGDKRIAQICGMAERTVADLRPKCSGSDRAEPEHRTGTDGKDYPTPGVAAAARRRAEQAIAADPSLSVRALAKLAGCSNGTAQDVIAKSKIEPQGELPPPPAAPGAGTVARPSADGDQRDDAEDGQTRRPSLGVVPPPSTDTAVGDVIDWWPGDGQWGKTEQFEQSNDAREFARLMDRRLPRKDDPAPSEIAAGCPAEMRPGSALAARAAAAYFTDLADALDQPARLTSVEGS